VLVPIIIKHSLNPKSISIDPQLPPGDRAFIDADDRHQFFYFNYCGTDTMLMNADLQTVAKYLDTHQHWFALCAYPLPVSPIDRHSYRLTLGKFNSCGYTIEPTICLRLLSSEKGTYRIENVSIPNYDPPYEVIFHAEMRLLEVSDGDKFSTQVNWDLDLNVCIRFPQFIYKLPTGVVQRTGDKLLEQIVDRISHRLTHKVRQNFHENF
jgi:hypothetical protein